MKRECGAGDWSLIRSCPRNCEREVSSIEATGSLIGFREGGRGDDPRARRPAVVLVDATNIGRGVSMDDLKDAKSFLAESFGQIIEASLLVLARAGGRLRED